MHSAKNRIRLEYLLGAHYIVFLLSGTGPYVLYHHSYSKNGHKGPLKNRQNKDLYDKW